VMKCLKCFFLHQGCSGSSSALMLTMVLSWLSLRTISGAAWTTALTSNIDDTTFHYYSDVWFNSTPFNTQFSATKNALFESYSTVFVEKVRITMDGTTGKTCGSSCTFTFSLPEAYSGRFTLMELVTTEGGIDMVDDREISWVRSFPVSSLSPLTHSLTHSLLSLPALFFR
jgi:hypothetical protein